MTSQTSEIQVRERRLPLLRAIQAEITERARLMAALEERLAAFAGTRQIHQRDVALLESDLSTQRRELRAIEKELARLGIAFDADNPHLLLEPTSLSISRRSTLEDTGFRPRYVDTRS